MNPIVLIGISIYLLYVYVKKETYRLINEWEERDCSSLQYNLSKQMWKE